ncbi:hypothetical protein H696_02431 [Fonticula alba]|uniref:Exostosin GT47 domain-containing protein n=1 Tax=Fonticula alba TaxID=691883 RepID=A0A058ZC23_FONAL|nr:hypothetical protein H696_02431 [Fonticula alba]KCV71486.1 hypothetical protein H696_02431 [Fonticula alba]|eukprot:XP_009494609.1 hypothetical protein H696_02431 [Fonticula alba]
MPTSPGNPGHGLAGSRSVPLALLCLLLLSLTVNSACCVPVAGTKIFIHPGSAGLTRDLLFSTEAPAGDMGAVALGRWPEVGPIAESSATEARRACMLGPTGRLFDSEVLLHVELLRAAHRCIHGARSPVVPILSGEELLCPFVATPDEADWVFVPVYAMRYGCRETVAEMRQGKALRRFSDHWVEAAFYQALDEMLRDTRVPLGRMVLFSGHGEGLAFIQRALARLAGERPLAAGRAQPGPLVITTNGSRRSGYTPEEHYVAPARVTDATLDVLVARMDRLLGQHARSAAGRGCPPGHERDATDRACRPIGQAPSTELLLAEWRQKAIRSSFHGTIQRDFPHSRGVRQLLQALSEGHALWEDARRAVGAGPAVARLALGKDPRNRPGEESRFCLCPPGFYEWSPRPLEAMMLGCVPVIFGDDLEAPGPGEPDLSRRAVLRVSYSTAGRRLDQSLAQTELRSEGAIGAMLAGGLDIARKGAYSVDLEEAVRRWQAAATSMPASASASASASAPDPGEVWVNAGLVNEFVTWLSRAASPP